MSGLGNVYGSQINAVVDAARGAQITEDPRELLTIILYALAVAVRSVNGKPKEVLANFPSAYANIDQIVQQREVSPAKKEMN